jgi:HK97 family phage major capsid protein
MLTRRMDRRSIPLAHEQRDMSATGTTSTAGDQGGMTVATTPMGLLDAFYSRLVFGPAGATILEGLKGNVNFPRYVKDTDPAFKSENASLDKLNPTTAMLSLTPHRLGAYELISEQLLMQSSQAIEAVLRNNLIRQLAAKVQAAHINGAGGSELSGILGTSGVGAVYAGGQISSSNAGDTISSTNPDGTSQVFADWVKLETAIGDVDGDWGEMAYITNPRVIGQAKRIKRGLAYPTDTSATDSVMIMNGDAGANLQCNGYRTFRTTGVPKTLSKGASSGILSALMFGVWADDYIGFWSNINLELLRDATIARTGQYQLGGAVYTDGGLVRPAAFAFCKDIKA